MSKLGITNLKSIMGGMRFLFGFCWKHDKVYILFLFFKQLSSSALPLILIFIPKHVLDMLVSSEDINTTLIRIVVLCCLYILMRLIDNYLDAHIFLRKLSIFNSFQMFLCAQLARADYGQIESGSFLDVKEKAFKFLYGEGGFASALEEMFALLGKLILFISIIAIISQLNFLLILGFIILTLINACFSSQSRKKANQFDMEKAPLERRNLYYYDLFSNYKYGKEIRINNLTDWLLLKYNTVLNHVLLSYKKIVKYRTRSDYIGGFFTGVQTFLVLIALALQFTTKKISAGDFMLFWNAANSFSAAMSSVTNSVVSILRYNDYYEAVKQFSNIPATIEGGEKQIAKIDLIEFKGVWFKYPGQDEYALRNINVEIRPKTKISIVGENGSGKSTFIKLLTRLYDVDKGEILINGVNIKDYDYASYSRQLSVVFQDSQLFSFSVLDNVTLSDMQEDNLAFFNAAMDKAGIGNKVASLHAREDTYIHKDFSDKGYEPSGGEVQKIAFARAIYKDGEFFILDEPTASLDPRSEYELYSNFNNVTKNKTVIYITHRLSSTKFSDTVLLFSKGSIIASGTHKQLYEQNEYYNELYNMQAQYYT